MKYLLFAEKKAMLFAWKSKEQLQREQGGISGHHRVVISILKKGLECVQLTKPSSTPHTLKNDWKFTGSTYHKGRLTASFSTYFS